MPEKRLPLDFISRRIPTLGKVTLTLLVVRDSERYDGVDCEIAPEDMSLSADDFYARILKPMFTQLKHHA